MPRRCARNWRRIEALLGLTLTSVLAQTDQRFRVVVAGHDRPESLPDDSRVTFLQAHWPVEAIDAANGDRGRKAHAVNARVLDDGGGLLMFLDADDWVDARLVAAARRTIGPQHAAAVIEDGFAVDFQTLRAAPLPDPRVFPGHFHRLCGSSVVMQIRPDDPDPFRRDPYRVLHQHHRAVEDAAAHRAALAHLPAAAVYVINTEQNHSETHGPYAGWRRTFGDAVNRIGVPVDAGFAARFGLRLDQLRAAVGAGALRASGSGGDAGVVPWTVGTNARTN